MKTPSGQGYGHTDDEQGYRLAGLGSPYNPADYIHDAVRIALTLIRGHAKRGGWLGEPAVRRAVDALSELVEWTEEQ